MKNITAIHILASPSSVDPKPEFAYVANIQYQDGTGLRSYENIGIPVEESGRVSNLFGIMHELLKFKVSEEAGVQQ